MNMGAGVQLPEYRCHKVVRAAKITDFKGHPASGTSVQTCELVLGDIGGVWTTTVKWCHEKKVEVGGYLVEYEDGYRSYSPAKAFEEGYTAITNPEWVERLASQYGAKQAATLRGDQHAVGSADHWLQQIAGAHWNEIIAALRSRR